MSTPIDKRYVSVKDLKELLNGVPDDLPVLYRLMMGEFTFREPSIRRGMAEHVYGAFWKESRNLKDSYEALILE